MTSATPSTPETPAVTLSSVLKPVMLVLIVAASLCLVYYSPAGEFLKPENVHSLDAWVGRWGALGPAAFVGVATVGMALGLPRIALSVIAGLVFGFLLGTLVAQIATVIAGLLNFLYGRYFGREFVQQRLRPKSPRLDRALSLVEKHGIGANILIRSAPVGHFLTTNLLMSVTPISARDFVIGTAIGTLPGTITYALLGSAGEGQRIARFAAATALMLVFSPGYVIYLRRRAKRGIDVP